MSPDNKRWPTAEERTMGMDSVDPNEIKPIDEKLDDKIAKLNSSRVYKKVTPRYDTSWYIKWVSSIFLIMAMILTSVNIFPINLYIALVGMIGWLIVGMIWHDRALIVLNAISVAIYGMGIVNSWIE